jgi:phenylalanine-4-hydroxylase
MQLPNAPAATPAGLRGDYSRADADYVVDQNWAAYTQAEHALWGRLVARQYALIQRYAARQVIDGLATLNLDSRVPDFEQASRALTRASGWRIVAVPGLIPDAHFFAHLAQRRFPVTVWLRTPAEMDYLVEPDVFHDFFGHVPLLCDPMFGDFMQAYGVAGAKAQSEGGLKMLARLYWYCVEFGLLQSGGDLRAYGAGILSSAGETVYSIEDARPQRVAFNLERVMRTDYMIDSYQKTYFVVQSFEQLFRDSYDRDFTPLYRRYRDAPSFAADALQPGDVLVPPGRGAAAAP